MDDAFGEAGVLTWFSANTSELRLCVSATNRGVAKSICKSHPANLFLGNSRRDGTGLRIGDSCDLEGRPLRKQGWSWSVSTQHKGRLLPADWRNRSDSQGSWRVREVPPSLDGLSCNHSFDFKSNQFELADSN
jgi:hypothetical protein